MKKNFLQDVIPASQKRSIRDIPLPVHQKNRTSVSSKKTLSVKESKYNDVDSVKKQDEVLQEKEYSFLKHEERSVFEPEHLHTGTIQPTFENEEESEFKESAAPIYKKTKKSNMKKIIIGLFVGIAVFLGFVLFQTEAIITIQPKKTDASVSSVIPLDSKTPLVTKIQISKSLSKTLTATSEQQVEKQASGRIKITNTHKDTPQELIKNTRFQTPAGLIYRIKDSIIVPGYTMSGSTIVPGTLEVEVYSDSAGEEYNISKTKFTIPGFAGREQFDKITAETVTDFTGGYIGIRKVVSEDVKEKAQEELEAELEAQIKQTQNQSTEYIIVPDPETLVFGELQDKAEGDLVTLSLSASADAYSFVKTELSDFIGQNSVSGAAPTDKFTLDSQNLTFEIEDKNIKINGSTIVTWSTDIEQLKKDFAGKKRSEAVNIIDTYRSFDKADASLSPFWKTRFPSDVEKIEVIITE